jgi:hypothetical protein
MMHPLPEIEMEEWDRLGHGRSEKFKNAHDQTT